MQKRKDGPGSRAYAAVAIVLGLLVALVSLARAADAAAPPRTPVLTQHAGKGQPLENGPATVSPAPPFTTAPSERVTNDPHWSAPNVRANTDTTVYAQQEPAIAVNPNNHLNVVAAAKDERSAPGPNTATKEVWIYTSTDGGQTWPVNVHIPMPDSSQPQQSDPVVTFSDDNTVYVTIIGYNQNNPTASNHTMVAHSNDGGLTWTSPAVYLNPTQGGSDKEWTAVDTNPSSPYYHRVYTTWTNFAAGPEFIEKWSSDGGVTWNPPGGSSYVTVSWGSEDSGQFSMPVVLPNGNVIATWNDFQGHVAVGKSTDGGQSFINPNHVAVSITDANSVPGAQWRLNTIPSTTASTATGTLVSVWADGRNGKDDIYFTRSTDGGTTWSAAARVAHNTAGSSYQVEPWLSVAPNGRFDVIWYDDRDFPGNLNTFHIYATHSTDDGVTWTGPDEQVTDASSNLNVGIPQGPGWNGAAGDYIGLASANDAAYGDWTDTRSGSNEDIYTSRYSPGPPQNTATPTVTSTPSQTPTQVATATSTSTSTPLVTETPCAITFTDVLPTDYFYQAVTYLYCHGVISGYSDNTFRPYNNTTRGQMSKIVVLGFGIPIWTPSPSATPTFSDVLPGNAFYQYVETAAHNNIVSGYADGTFRPNSNVTRGQLSKIIVVGATIVNGWPLLNPPTATFSDVPTTSPFYTYIETAYCHQIISGYSDGTFRPFADATRGQISKIQYLAIQNTATCAVTPTATVK